MINKTKNFDPMRIVAAILVVFATLIATSSCSKKEPAKPMVLLILKSASAEFFIEIEKGFREGWTNTGVDVSVQSGLNPSDVESQRKFLEAAAIQNDRRKHLVGVVITPAASGNELVPAIKALRDGGIPVLLVDTGIDEELMKAAGTNYNVFLASDNLAGGKLAAQVLLEGISGRKSCSVLILGGAPASDTAQQRRKGFVDEFAELAKSRKLNCSTPIEKTANWDRTQARTTLEALHASGQRFDGIFAANDEMALGAIEGWQISRAGAKPVIVGFDAIKDALKQIGDGELYASIAQDPAKMGKSAAQALANITEHRDADVFKRVPIDVKAIRK